MLMTWHSPRYQRCAHRGARAGQEQIRTKFLKRPGPSVRTEILSRYLAASQVCSPDIHMLVIGYRFGASGPQGSELGNSPVGTRETDCVTISHVPLTHLLVQLPLSHLNKTLILATQLPVSESMFSKAKSLWLAIAIGVRKTCTEEGQCHT